MEQNGNMPRVSTTMGFTKITNADNSGGYLIPGTLDEVTSVIASMIGDLNQAKVIRNVT